MTLRRLSISLTMNRISRRPLSLASATLALPLNLILPLNLSDRISRRPLSLASATLPLPLNLILPLNLSVSSPRYTILVYIARTDTQQSFGD